MDDSTIFDVCNNTSVHMIQESADIITDLSMHNDMRINARKTKEMMIRFCRNRYHVASIPRIVLDDNDIERVTQAKVLGVKLSADLSWNALVDTIVGSVLSDLCWNTHARYGIRPFQCIYQTTLELFKGGVFEQYILGTVMTRHDQSPICQLSLSERRTKLCQSYFRKMHNADHK